MNSTPLYPLYQNYNAKVIDFHGWALPVQFSSIIQEHRAVRNRVGLFDVSHMGEILVQGPDGLSFLDYALTNKIASLQPGYIRYSPLCLESGGTVDDLLVYCLQPDKYLLVVNASNIDKDLNFLRQASSGYKVSITDLSAETALLALQGPLAIKVLSKLTNTSLADMRYYQFFHRLTLGRLTVLLSRTGYTGEDGFEIYLPSDQAPELWETLMNTGASYGITPAGLGARDTLRLEAGLPLYGNELSEEISPVEAGLGRFVNLEKPTFIGKSQLQKRITEGVDRQLIGIRMIDRGIPRSGYQIYKGENLIGYITSGTYSPTLDQNIGLALIETAFAQPNVGLTIDIRGKKLHAVTEKLPFYTRPRGVEKR